MSTSPHVKVEVEIHVLPEVIEKYLPLVHGPTGHPSWYAGAETPSASQMSRFREALANGVGDALEENHCVVRYVQRVWSGRSSLRGAECLYCGGGINVTVTASLRRVMYYETPPPGAKDLRKLIDDQWIIERRNVLGTCIGPCGRTFAKTYESRV